MNRIPRNLLPYLPDNHGEFSQEAIDAFHAYTGQGKSPWLVAPKEKEAAIQFKDLCEAHDIASHPEYSGILEGLWVEGWGDYPMRVMLQAMIGECVGNPQKWVRQLPLFERAYRFSARQHGNVA
uniref:Uncharacterized protein n=1 Tax=viral metagenome TaxID=1070528 RepID=A0A6M3LC61_9ZZZZ